jgi:predicted DCC family thiol-disulfide oxidoreductase YuxK
VQTEFVNRDPIFVFDGDCAFCSSCVRLGQRVLSGPVQWRAWQFLDLGALGLTRDEVREAVQWVDSDGTVLAGPAAIAALLRASGPGWAVVGRILALRPAQWLAWPLYRLVARNRHRLPGGTAACAIPR